VIDLNDPESHSICELEWPFRQAYSEDGTHLSLPLVENNRVWICYSVTKQNSVVMNDVVKMSFDFVTN